MDYYIIGYDLNKSGQDYNKLYRHIKSVGEWWHSLGSTWIVKSDKTADEIHAIILDAIDENGELLVALLCDEVAWCGFTGKGKKWLEDNFYDCKKHGSKRKKDKDCGNDDDKSKKDKDCDKDKDKSSKTKKGKGHEGGHGYGNDDDKSKKPSKSKKKKK